MLKAWMTLRQIGADLKEGRLDEAWHLLRDPAVRHQQRGKEYLLRAGIGFLGRAKIRAKDNQLAAAMKDLRRAKEAGVEDTSIELVKNDVINQHLNAFDQALNAGQPSQALSLLETLKQQGLQTTKLAAMEDVAHALVDARDHVRRGEFAQATKALERVKYRDFPALVNLHREWGKHQELFADKCNAMHVAAGQQHWRQVVKLADELLVLAPEHEEVRKARHKAWKMLEPPTHVHQKPSPAASAPLDPSASALKELDASLKQPDKEDTDADTPRRLLCWIDGVGGYLLCLAPRVSLGRATGDATVDIPLFADVSRLHAYLSRDSEGGYVLEAVRPVKVNGKPVERVLLKDGDELTLGTACVLRFRQPLAVSGTARLDLVSRHRLPLSIDGVLLMADACLLGDNTNTHVTVPGLNRPLALVRAHEALAVQCAGQFQVDGKDCKGRAPLKPKSTVQADEFRLKLEPVGSRFVGK
jgi:hypothetical protein